MGKDRKGYSKTDLEATFMRMKEKHMFNCQLVMVEQSYLWHLSYKYIA